MAGVVFSGLMTRTYGGSPDMEASRCIWAPKVEQAELMSMPGASIPIEPAMRDASQGIAMSG